MIYGLVGIFVIIILIIWTISSSSFIHSFMVSIFLLCLFVPYEIFKYGFEGSILSKISPFALYILLVFIIYCFIKAPLIIHLSLKKITAYNDIFLFIIYILLISVTIGSGKGLGTFLDNYLAPVFTYFIILNSKKWINPNKTLKKIIYIGIVAAILAIIEFIIKENIILGEVFYNQVWITSQWNEKVHRSTGLIGHPLIGATIYLMYMSVLDENKSNVWVYLFIFLLAVVSTGSRFAFMLSLFIIFYFLYLQKISIYKVLIFYLIIIAGLGLIAAGYFNQILYRFYNSSGSNIVRISLLKIIPSIGHNFLLGRGLGTSGPIANSMGFYNNIEIPWIAFIFEVGFAGLVLLGNIVMRVFSNLRSEKISFFLFILMISSFNSISVHFSGTVLLIILIFLKEIKMQGEHGV